MAHEPEFLPGWPEEWKKQPGDPAGWDPEQWVYPQQLRGEQVATQTGGLAAAVMGRDEDDDDPFPTLPELPGALEAASPGRRPAHLPTQSSRRGNTITNDAAIARLNEARYRLIDRRDKIERDKTDQWLALAQGMLAPTKTGGFGESLGVSAGLIRGARSDKREQLTDIERDLLDAEVKSQQLALSARPRLGSSDDVYHPDDAAEFPDNPEKWRIIQKQTIVHSDGTVEHIFTGTDTGELLQVVSPQNPITVRHRDAAAVAGRIEATRAQHDIDQGLIATIATSKLRDARAIFADIQTGGLKSGIARIGEFLNIRIANDADFRVIRRLIGDEVLTQLSRLTGTKTDFEYQKIESLNASTEASQEANLRILDEMLGRYDRIIQIGERAAIAKAVNLDEDLSVMRYREYRVEEEGRKELELHPRVKIAPAHHNDKLVDQFDLDNPNNDRLIEFYRTRYGWPPVDPEVLSELRKKGYEG